MATRQGEGHDKSRPVIVFGMNSLSIRSTSMLKRPSCIAGFFCSCGYSSTRDMTDDDVIRSFDGRRSARSVHTPSMSVSRHGTPGISPSANPRNLFQD